MWRDVLNRNAMCWNGTDHCARSGVAGSRTATTTTRWCGDNESIAAVVPLGVDTLDSCNPTRLGRHGSLLTRDGPIRITVIDRNVT